jgi:hypothetical protein
MRQPDDGRKSCEKHLRDQIEGYQASAIIYAAVKLELPDAMGSSSWTVEHLAKQTGLSPSPLLRLLRALAALGICRELPKKQFELSSAGIHLQAASSSCLREKAIIVVEQYWQPWANLVHSLQSGETAFERAFGMSPWEWRRAHADQGAVFNAWLAKETNAQAKSILEILEFSQAARVADIGGGSGGLIAAILNSHPSIRGILFDQEQTVAEAKAFLRAVGVGSRVEFVSGDFFAEIGVEANYYLLKSVLHDWSDAECLTILRNCRKAMPANSKLLIIERILPDQASSDKTAIMMDIHMMIVTGGRERGLQEFEGLLSQVGFAVARVARGSSGFTVIEAVLC